MRASLKQDLILGEIAALEDLISTCESDIGNYRRDDRTDRQNAAMWDSLEKLKTEFTARRATLLAKL